MTDTPFRDTLKTLLTAQDFGAIATACGLTHIRDVNAFVSKVMVFDKP
jgi:hypothetical protein